MNAIPYARISHVGIYVRDLDRMVEFYRRVLGFMVTDRGPHPSGAPEYAFMSRDPDEHHQLVFVTGRPAGTPSQIVQISLKMASIADLRRMYGIVRADAEAGDIQTRAHGIAWSLYFADPEGNTVEAFTPSPWYVHAPSAVPFSFDDMTDREIFDHVAAAVAQKPGYSTYDEWKASAADRMRAGGHWPG
ncbi:MAG: VOC family protein [Rhodospirillaceae bacterium]